MVTLIRPGFSRGTVLPPPLREAIPLLIVEYSVSVYRGWRATGNHAGCGIQQPFYMY